MNEEAKESFEQGIQRLRPGYALTPICSMTLANYDDTKVNLTGIIDNREFAELLKANFMKVMAY